MLHRCGTEVFGVAAAGDGLRWRASAGDDVRRRVSVWDGGFLVLRRLGTALGGDVRCCVGGRRLLVACSGVETALVGVGRFILVAEEADNILSM